MRLATPRVTVRGMRTPLPASSGEGPTAMLLTGCVMDIAFRPVHQATIDAVVRGGYRAVVPRGGGCCGALAAHAGELTSARELARKRIAELEQAEVIVVDSAGCSAHMRTYGHLLADDPAWAHLRPRGVAVLLPDHVRETYRAGTAHGGSDGVDGRGARFLEWTWDPDPRHTSVVQH